MIINDACRREALLASSRRKGAVGSSVYGQGMSGYPASTRINRAVPNKEKPLPARMRGGRRWQRRIDYLPAGVNRSEVWPTGSRPRVGQLHTITDIRRGKSNERTVPAGAALSHGLITRKETGDVTLTPSGRDWICGAVFNCRWLQRSIRPWRAGDDCECRERSAVSGAGRKGCGRRRRSRGKAAGFQVIESPALTILAF